MPLASAGLVRTDRGEEPRLTEQSCHAATNYQQTPAQTDVSVQLPETSAAVRTPLSSLRGPAADRYRKPPATTTRLLRQGGETEFEISHANEDHIGTTKMHGSSQPAGFVATIWCCMQHLSDTGSKSVVTTGRIPSVSPRAQTLNPDIIIIIIITINITTTQALETGR